MMNQEAKDDHNFVEVLSNNIYTEIMEDQSVHSPWAETALDIANKAYMERLSVITASMALGVDPTMDKTDYAVFSAAERVYEFLINTLET